MGLTEISDNHFAGYSDKRYKDKKKKKSKELFITNNQRV